MQTVNSAFTAEERDKVRNIAQNTQVSWKRFNTLTNRTFAIGVSTIGGNDAIGIDVGAIGSPSNYKYFDESSYVTMLAWDRGLNMPLGGLTKALAEAQFDNTSGRFTPRHMGGNSELFTAQLPRRPMILGAGFEMQGVDITIPQFAGVTTKQPYLDTRNKTVRIEGADYVDFFQNRYLDQEVMFTSQRTDEVLTNLMESMGLSTSQYDIDYGINLIPFGLFEKGTRYSDIINELTQAENGHFYQDEEGVFKFENRQHWDSSPYNAVQRIVLTGQVLNAESPNEDHIVNVVEIRAGVRNKQPEQTIFSLNAFDYIEVPASSSVEIFVDFENPVLALTTPTAAGDTSYYRAFDNTERTGTDYSTSVTLTKVTRFAKAAKLSFSNTTTSILYVTDLVITGRWAVVERELYYRAQDDSSVTAYQERLLSIENKYIQSEDWANSLAQMILNDHSAPENLQKINIRAIPELQLGDLISWQGRHWRVFGIKSTIDAMVGFIQELTLLQRTITTYFRIGISTIGGSDKIAP